MENTGATPVYFCLGWPIVMTNGKDCLYNAAHDTS